MGIDDFESRLHQLAINQAALDTLVTEGDSYWSSITVHEQDKWEREARKRKWLFTNDVSYLDIQIFNISTPSNIILDETNNAILDQNNNSILEE